MTKDKGTGIWYCDTIEEFEEMEQDLKENPDFTFLGDYDLLRNIFEELEYQGFREREILDMSNNRYGRCLDILLYNNRYTVYIGQR